MSTTPAVPPDAHVIVADARKALLFKNTGALFSPRLKFEGVITADPNPADREQGTDRPGRAATGSHRSSLAQTNRHELEEQRFLVRLADEVSRLCHAGEMQKIVLVAPPRALAILRQALPKILHDRIIAEHDMDLVNLPVPEIERHLS